MSVDDLRQLNKRTEGYIKNHGPSYTFDQFPKRDANVVIVNIPTDVRYVAIVAKQTHELLACMDPRSNPNELWGITESNPGAAVLRNAGGRVTEDVLRSLRVLGGIIGYGENTLGGVAVIHHKDCGMTHFRNERIGELLAEHVGLEGERAKEAKGLDYGEITDVEASVWEDMKKIKADPYLPKTVGVVGYVWDSIGNTMTEVGTL